MGKPERAKAGVRGRHDDGVADVEMGELSPQDRIRGCLLGGAIGDALGAGIEFSSLPEVRDRYGPDGVTGFVPAYGRSGTITDDTQMTLFTVEALIRARDGESGLADEKAVIDALWAGYQRWLITQEGTPAPIGDPDSPYPYGGPAYGDPAYGGGGQLVGGLVDEPVLRHRRAPGNTCLAGLRRDSPAEPLPVSCRTSKGCGTVMRSAPFGLVGMGPAWTAQLAYAGSELTHGHPTAGHSSAALALIVEALLRGLPVRSATLAAIDVVNRTYHDAGETLVALVNALSAAENGPPTAEVVESLGSGWVAEEALAIAVYCVLAAPDARTAMLAAVNHSGDSDSTGAICGNILGAGFGLEVFPAEWVRDVEAADLIRWQAEIL